MRTLFVILFLSLCGVLSAQDRYIEIPEADAPALKQYKINWHTGIDPVQIKDGTWVLPEKVLPLIPEKISITADEKEVVSDLKVLLTASKIVTLTTIDFKEPEPIEPIVEPIIKEIIKK